MADKKVKADDLVEITGTGKSKFLKKGVKKIVHKLAAEKLVASEAATIGDAVPAKDKSGKDKGKGRLDM